MQMNRRDFLGCIGAGAVASIVGSELTSASAQQMPVRFEINYFRDGRFLGSRGVWDYPTNELIPPGTKVVECIHIYRGTEHEVREHIVGRDIYGNFVN